MSVDRLCLKCGYIGPVYTNPNGTERPHPRPGHAGSSAVPECGYLIGTPADDARSAALSAARDEVVRAAQYEVEHGYARPPLGTAVAALARLEGL